MENDRAVYVSGISCDNGTIRAFVSRLIGMYESWGEESRRENVEFWIKSECELRNYDEKVVNEMIAELLP